MKKQYSERQQKRIFFTSIAFFAACLIVGVIGVVNSGYFLPWGSKAPASGVAMAQPNPSPLPMGKTPYALIQQPSPFVSPGQGAGSSSQVLPAAPALPNGMVLPGRGMQDYGKPLTVKGIFPGKGGKSCAIIGRGQDQIAVQEGMTTKYGTVTSITPDSVVVNDVVITFNPVTSSDSTEKQLANIPSPPINTPNGQKP